LEPHFWLSPRVSGFPPSFFRILFSLRLTPLLLGRGVLIDLLAGEAFSLFLPFFPSSDPLVVFAKRQTSTLFRRSLFSRRRVRTSPLLFDIIYPRSFLRTFPQCSSEFLLAVLTLFSGRRGACSRSFFFLLRGCLSPKAH